MKPEPINSINCRKYGSLLYRTIVEYLADKHTLFAATYGVNGYIYIEYLQDPYKFHDICQIDTRNSTLAAIAMNKTLRGIFTYTDADILQQISKLINNFNEELSNLDSNK